MVGLGSFSRCYIVHDCLDFPPDDSVERRLVMQSLTSAQRLPPQFPTPAPPLQQQLAPPHQRSLFVVCSQPVE